MVLVTGEPPADPEVLSEALGNVAGPGHGVVIISCGPELKPADLERAVPKLAKPKAGGVWGGTWTFGVDFAAIHL